MNSKSIYCPIGRSILNAVVLSGVLAFSIQSQGATVTLNDGNSTAIVDLSSAAGMYNWSVDAQNQLNTQWFYYRIGNSGVAQSIHTIGLTGYTMYGANEVVANYGNGQLSVNISYQLLGGLSGSGTAQILESISVHNNSLSSTLDLHFFQYSDFDLGGTPLGDSIAISGSPGPGFNYVSQTKGPGLSIGEAIVSPFANGAETDDAFNTLTRLTSISGYDLNNNTASGPGNVTWALQWDANVAIDGDLDVFKGKRLAIVPIPEPSSLALLAVGISAWGLVRRRRI